MKGGLRGAQRAVHIKCVHIRAGAFLSSNTVFVFWRLWRITGSVVMYCLYIFSFILLQPDEFFAWCFSCILPSLYEESQYSLYSAAARAMWQVFPIEKFPIWFSTFIFVVAGNMVFRKQQVIVMYIWNSCLACSSYLFKGTVSGDGCAFLRITSSQYCPDPCFIHICLIWILIVLHRWPPRDTSCFT